MNSISQMIYWADVAPNLAAVLAWLFGLLALASVGCLCVYFAARAMDHKVKAFDDAVLAYNQHVAANPNGRFSNPNEYGSKYNLDSSDREFAAWAYNLSFVRFTFPLCLLLFAVTFFVPSKDTFYLIAGSEIGEQAVQTPEFSKVRTLLNKWLDKQITPAEKKDDK